MKAGRVVGEGRMTLWNGDKREGEETRVIQLLVRRTYEGCAITLDCSVEQDPCIETRWIVSQPIGSGVWPHLSPSRDFARRNTAHAWTDGPPLATFMVS